MFRRSLLSLHLHLRPSQLTSHLKPQTPFAMISSQSSPKDQPSAASASASTSISTPSSPRNALPAPGNNDNVTVLDVSGDGTTVKLGALGPLVVNQDGTMSRIANWDQMADIEKKNTLRIMGKRNQVRLAALRQAHGIDAGNESGSANASSSNGQDDTSSKQ